VLDVQTPGELQILCDGGLTFQQMFLLLVCFPSLSLCSGTSFTIPADTLNPHEMSCVNALKSIINLIFEVFILNRHNSGNDSGLLRNSFGIVRFMKHS